jgi:hypothetical protein
MATQQSRHVVAGLSLLFVAGALLAGCGGGRHAQSGSAEQRATDALRDFARCVRAHGLPDFPDPTIRSDGVPRLPDDAPDVPVAAQQACRSVAARIPAHYTESTPVAPADFQKLVRLARCIRSHGLPAWPDPNGLGQFPISARIQQGGKRIVLPALRACARTNPDPNGGINVVRAQSAR